MRDPAWLIRELRRSELEEAACVVAQGMCDNPVNVSAFVIADRERRCRALLRFFRPVLRGLRQRGLVYGAFRDGAMVGVCAVAEPNRCQPEIMEKLVVAPPLLLGNPLKTTLRVLQWTAEWARRDPAQPHWHLGPVAVRPDFQGQGVGSAMLAECCRHIDTLRMPTYLETDKAQNLSFYRKYGFIVVAEAEVIGVPNWFMLREGRE